MVKEPEGNRTFGERLLRGDARLNRALGFAALGVGGAAVVAGAATLAAGAALFAGGNFFAAEVSDRLAKTFSKK